MGRTIWLTVVLATIPSTSFAVDGVPAGPEFRVSPVGDTYTNSRDGSVWDPRAVPTSDGGFAVVWESYSYDYGYFYSSYGRGIRMRRFGPTGTPKGGETKVFFDEDGYGFFRPSVGVDANDQFTVVWSNFEDVGGEEKGRVWARRFNQAGNPLTNRFEVTPDGGAYSNAQARNEVAVRPNGEFLVVWEDYVLDPQGSAIMARRYDASATPQSAPFQVNQESGGSSGYVAVAAGGDGDFSVVWTDWAYGDFVTDTVARRLGPTGTPLGDTFEVFDHHNDELANRVAAAEDGNVMILGWEPSLGLTGRVYDGDGAALTGEFVVDEDGDYGNVQAGPDGNFLVAWQEGNYGDIFGRWFSPGGAALGARFKVNEDNDFAISNPGLASPAIAIDQAGDFVVAWANDYGQYPEDPSESEREGPGVWARRFTSCGNALVGRSETCDDGDADAGDGCSARCQAEACFQCSGTPSTCTQAAGCTTVCSDGARLDKPSLTFSKIGAPLGDEAMGFRGKIVAPPLGAGEYDPSIEGIQVAVNGANLIYQVTIPPGLVGSGCGPKDGWKVGGNPLSRSYAYKNVSGAFPPGCAPGSAAGMKALALKDKLTKSDTLEFKAKVAKGSIPAVPPPPVTATIVLGDDAVAGQVGRCGLIRFERAIGTRFFP